MNILIGILGLLCVVILLCGIWFWKQSAGLDSDRGDSGYNKYNQNQPEGYSSKYNGVSNGQNNMNIYWSASCDKNYNGKGK